MYSEVSEDDLKRFLGVPAGNCSYNKDVLYDAYFKSYNGSFNGASTITTTTQPSTSTTTVIEQVPVQSGGGGGGGAGAAVADLGIGMLTGAALESTSRPSYGGGRPVNVDVNKTFEGGGFHGRR